MRFVWVSLFSLSFLLVGCTPFIANRPVEVEKVYQPPKSPNHSLQEWRATKLQEISQLNSQLQKEWEEIYKDENPFFSDELF
jgi:hypothetical protein